ERGVLGEVPPKLRIDRRVFDVGAHERGRAFAFEELAGGVAQQFLIGGQREIHGYLRGKPSTRWAMMLRWISELPPAIVFANDMKKPCTKRSVGTPRTGADVPMISIPSSNAALPASEVAIFM